MHEKLIKEFIDIVDERAKKGKLTAEEHDIYFKVERLLKAIDDDKAPPYMRKRRKWKRIHIVDGDVYVDNTLYGTAKSVEIEITRKDGEQG